MIRALIEFVSQYIGVLASPPLSLEVLGFTVICTTIFAGKMLARMIRR